MFYQASKCQIEAFYFWLQNVYITSVWLTWDRKGFGVTVDRESGETVHRKSTSATSASRKAPEGAHEEARGGAHGVVHGGAHGEAPAPPTDSDPLLSLQHKFVPQISSTCDIDE